MELYLLFFSTITILAAWVIYLAFSPSKVELFFNEKINQLDITDRSIIRKTELVPNNCNVFSVKWLDFLLSESPILSGRKLFYPTPWLRNGHLQTFYTSLISSKGSLIKYDRELFSLDDGGQVALDWYPKHPKHQDSELPLAVILHGLTGNSQEGYCRATVKRLTDSGVFRVVVFNYRGCGETEILVPRMYNGGDTRDLKEVLAYIHNLTPTTRKLAVGFSLGANLLVKYLGEEGENSVFSGAVSVSNPCDLVDFSNMFLTQPFLRKFYDPALASGLVNLLERHTILKGHYNQRKWKSVRGFDRDVTRKMSGFRTVNDYYRWASSDQYVTGVRVPLLLLNAKDDSISPELAIPYQECKNNPYVILATTHIGGHIGWWEGLVPRLWFPSLVEEYLVTLNKALEGTVPPQFINRNS